MILHFRVSGQQIFDDINEVVVADSIDYLRASFAFSPEWNGLTKTAIFKTAEGVTFSELLVGNECIVPHEVIRPKYMKVSVFGVTSTGVKRITATERIVHISASGYTDDSITLPPPTPDIYQQMVSVMNAQAVDAVRAETAQEEAEQAERTAKSHAEQTGEDRIATGEDRVATGADRSAVNTALTGFAETTLPNAIQAVEDKADTEIARVRQAGDTQTQAVNAAGAEQIGLATAQADRAESEADIAATSAGAALSAKQAAETAQGKAEDAQVAAETSATNAAASNQNAATHEQAAKDYADTAAQSNTEAGLSATAAAKSEAEAARYAAQIARDIDSFYNRLALQVASKEDMDALFVEWWHENWVEGTTTRLELLERWFGSVLQDARTHGVKEPLFATSNTAIAELTDDSVGLTCVPSTEAAANRDDFAGLPQFWALEVSWEKTTTGSIEVYAVELIDDIDVVRSGESHMCGVAQKNTYFRDWIVDGYHYLKTRCYPSSGYTQWDDGKTADGVVHAFAIRPKYCTGGINKSGVATCGTNLAPMNSMVGPTTGVTKWRARGARYAGARGSVLFWQLAMIRLKYARKGNSGTIEGCTGFYTHYAAAVSETAVSRILLTVAQAANLFVGCNTCIGDGEYASTKANNVRIKSITPVTVDGATYSAVILDTTTTFDVVAGTTKISVLPYWSGWCDMVKGNDGSRYSATSGKETGLIQKTEFQNGAYQILADELWQWGKDADGNFTFDCYTCDDQSKVTTGGTVSADYKKLEGATMTFPADQGNGWLYIEDMMAMPGGRTLWPRKVSAQAGSGTGVKAGFRCYPAASGLRAAWCCCYLGNGGFAGLAARYSSYGVGDAYWGGSVGCPSMAG